MRIYLSSRRNFGLRPSVSFDVRELQGVASASWPIRATAIIIVGFPLLIVFAAAGFVLIAAMLVGP
jgi:hypothetical protein